MTRREGVELGGILGAALVANLEGRLLHFIVDGSSPAIELFSPEHRAGNQEGDWYGEHAGKWLVAAARAAARSATAREHDLPRSTRVFVEPSPARRSRAARVPRPPMASVRSRSPAPTACDTPPPSRWMSPVSSRRPAPEAATTPMSPRLTAVAKPSGTPSSSAAPQSGPITSRPRASARVLSETSSSTVTPSLTSITERPCSSARRASRAAKGPGTDTTARCDSGCLASAWASVRGASSMAVPWATRAPAVGREEIHASARFMASRTVGSSSACATTSRSPGFGGSGHCGGARAILRSTSRLRGVAIIATARRTPGADSRCRVSASSTPASRYSSARIIARIAALIGSPGLRRTARSPR